MVRKGILGESERKVLEAYLKGQRLKNYQTVIWRIRELGLKAIIVNCERDLKLLKALSKREESLHS